jgi:hypothetical protein
MEPLHQFEFEFEDEPEDLELFKQYVYDEILLYHFETA